jgi:hypothetical protein
MLGDPKEIKLGSKFVEESLTTDIVGLSTEFKSKIAGNA